VKPAARISASRGSEGQARLLDKGGQLGTVGGEAAEADSEHDHALEVAPQAFGQGRHLDTRLAAAHKIDDRQLRSRARRQPRGDILVVGQGLAHGGGADQRHMFAAQRRLPQAQSVGRGEGIIVERFHGEQGSVRSRHRAFVNKDRRGRNDAQNHYRGDGQGQQRMLQQPAGEGLPQRLRRFAGQSDFGFRMGAIRYGHWAQSPSVNKVPNRNSWPR
jgi:hypothetical protein